MTEIKLKKEVTEVKISEPTGFRDIKPQTDMSQSKAGDTIKGIFDKLRDGAERFLGKVEAASNGAERYYSEYKDRIKFTPIDGDRGNWEGQRGESKYVPSENTEKGRDVKQLLTEKGVDGIEYKNGEPDFSPMSENTVKIESMTEDRRKNFQQADIECAEQWNADKRGGRTDWTPVDVRDWRRENEYSWHERCDTETMDLVPTAINDYFRHVGGCSECRIRDSKDKWDGFDE